MKGSTSSNVRERFLQDKLPTLGSIETFVNSMEIQEDGSKKKADDDTDHLPEALDIENMQMFNDKHTDEIYQ